MTPPIVDLSDFAGGAVAERFNHELQKVLENIADPNTDPKKTRSVTLTVSIKADEHRDVANVSINTKSTIVAPKPLETKLLMDHDTHGKVVASELKSGVKGQTYINENSEISDDTGKVIDMRSAK